MNSNLYSHSLMASMVFSIALLICSISLGSNEVVGISSKKEDLDLERELPSPRKQHITGIQTDYGDIFDCVDFYRQPAFKHLLLKNRTSQTIPSYVQKRMKAKAMSPLKIGPKDRRCPTGTVPIMRSSKNQLFSKKDISNMNSLGGNEFGHYYAIIRTKSSPSKKFLGTESYLSLHNPEVSGSQFSAGQMKLSNGPDSIQVGWMVNLDLFKDNETRLFIHFTAGATQCYNLQCPGFVQVSSQVAVGDAASKTSVLGGPCYAWKLAIAKDPNDGNWWLIYGRERIRVGYWPKEIFTNLADVASQVQWGGEVFTPRGQFPPKMGTGVSPLPRNSLYAASCQIITVVDESFHNVVPDDIETYTDGIFDYSVIDVGYQGDYFGYMMLFGGAG